MYNRNSIPLCFFCVLEMDFRIILRNQLHFIFGGESIRRGKVTKVELCDENIPR